jgi:single-stranded-DNA-specific exonuclease
VAPSTNREGRRVKREIRRRALPSTPVDLGPVDPLLGRLYAARGVRAAGELSLGLGGLIPVGRFAGLAAAVDLLCRHREAGSRILVVGDFDADGATSTAVLLRGLRALDFPAVDFLVPNRFEFGYGLSPELVAVARERQPGLIVTVDNGVSSVEGVAAARAAGIDVLVTDHHLPPSTLPAANAIANPSLADEPFPDTCLAGVGVAFYLIAALGRRLSAPGRAREIAAGLLDLVALGTVADVVPLSVNNRILVEQGLRRIRSGRCAPGVTALLEAGRRVPARAVASDLGFAAGPRLNAAGRIEDMSIGIRCLLTDDAAEARRLAARLDELNLTRRDIEADMQATALAAVERLRAGGTDGLPPGLTLHAADWHAGVVGLVASRVKDAVHRPVVAFAPDGPDRWKGSARSIPGFHIRDALAEVERREPGLIERFGGHAMAAGLSLERTRLETFRETFEAVARDALTPEHLLRVLLTDGELRPEDLNLDTAERLRSAGPWGQDFPEPLFDGEFTLEHVRVMKDVHLKLTVRAGGQGQPLEAVAFNQAAALASDRPARLRLVYRPDVNIYRGLSSLQLIVQHLEPL